MLSRLLLALMVTLAGVTFFPSPGQHRAIAQSQSDPDISTEEISFASGDVTLNGTVLIPDGDGPWPAVVLVHGSGLGERDRYLEIGEAFARSGVLALAYDKRTEGYAASGGGGRDYDLLADDALAAIAALKGRSDVRPDVVGLWGLSEGAWVVPIAAARSGEVAFAVLAGASLVPPAQQESWRHEHLLRHAGVSGSLLETIPRDMMHLLVTTELLSEAAHDPLATIEQVEQPMLAVWGVLERSVPPVESAQLLTEATARSGNDRASIAFIPNANHRLGLSTDGFSRQPEFAPGYFELITSWVNDVAAGNPPAGSVSGEAPVQEFLSWPDAANPPGILSGGWLQIVATFVLLLAFPLFALLGMFGRRTPPPPTMRGPARWLAVSAWLATVGLVVYLFSYLLIGVETLGPVLFGRPLPWIGLQILAFVALVAAVALAVGWARAQPDLSGLQRSRYQILLTGAIVFVPWALYWGLLTP